MNRKSAFDILGLGQGASLSQAKKAFRQLAKRYHPDRYSANQDPGMNTSLAEARMKQINRAFHFLAPLLRSTDDLPDDLLKKASEKVPRGKKISESPWYRYIVFPMIKMFKNGLKFNPGQPGTFVKKPGPKMDLKTKQTVKPRGGIGKRTGFDTILNNLSPEALVFQKKRGNKRFRGGPLPRNREHLRDAGYPRDKGYPYGNYMKYVALKKKIAGRRGGQENSTRIERIRPVSRVNPIGSRNGSKN